MPPTAEAASFVLIAAALLRVPARRMRALALGDDGALREWVANESAQRLADARRDARIALARLEKLGARVVTLADSGYPPGLRDLADPPAFLCVMGSLGRSFRCGTAIVGSREADDEARAFASDLARRSAAPIVSGLAVGIDAAAHEGALASGSPTIAYVGHGPGATYPPEHRDLETRIVASGGAIVSELLPGERVTRWSLVRRDRLQAAHVRNVVLVQSEAAGGAMHALAVARKLGRQRFVVEPRPGERYDGNRIALRDGARQLPWEPTIAAAALNAAALLEETS